MQLKTALIGDFISCTSIDFTPNSDDNQIASGHENGALCLWDVTEKKITKRVKLGGYKVD